MDWWLVVLRSLLTVSLYLFLGAIFWLLWRDLQRQTTPADVLVPRQYGRLVVVEVASTEGDDSTDRLPRPGAAFSLQPFTSLGRASANTVTLPDAYASAEHALLALRGGKWWLEDRGSRNGTTLNGVLIDSPTVVSAGDIIGIGRVQLKLELVD